MQRRDLRQPTNQPMAPNSVPRRYTKFGSQTRRTHHMQTVHLIIETALASLDVVRGTQTNTPLSRAMLRGRDNGHHVQRARLHTTLYAKTHVF